MENKSNKLICESNVVSKSKTNELPNLNVKGSATLPSNNLKSIKMRSNGKKSSTTKKGSSANRPKHSMDRKAKPIRSNNKAKSQSIANKNKSNIKGSMVKVSKSVIKKLKSNVNRSASSNENDNINLSKVNSPNQRPLPSSIKSKLPRPPMSNPTKQKTLGKKPPPLKLLDKKRIKPKVATKSRIQSMDTQTGSNLTSLSEKSRLSGIKSIKQKDKFPNQSVTRESSGSKSLNQITNKIVRYESRVKTSKKRSKVELNDEQNKNSNKKVNSAVPNGVKKKTHKQLKKVEDQVDEDTIDIEMTKVELDVKDQKSQESDFNLIKEQVLKSIIIKDESSSIKKVLSQVSNNDGSQKSRIITELQVSTPPPLPSSVREKSAISSEKQSEIQENMPVQTIKSQADQYQSIIVDKETEIQNQQVGSNNSSKPIDEQNFRSIVTAKSVEVVKQIESSSPSKQMVQTKSTNIVQSTGSFERNGSNKTPTPMEQTKSYFTQLNIESNAEHNERSKSSSPCRPINQQS
ncbi:hypothetical protein BLOT_012991 [Blomia tropicalis]|nr:hypothetical protein BLOT_012991 [Blomia tropicalis]